MKGDPLRGRRLLSTPRIFHLVFLFSIFYTKASAQHQVPDTLAAGTLFGKIKTDGILDEPEWAYAKRIDNFTQREPIEGLPGSECTEVAVLFGETAIYVGIWCYDSKPGKIEAKFLERDFNYQSDDNFEIALSPFNDQRSGYIFTVNPNGARADGQIISSEDVNDDWNGVWDAAARRTAEGWFVEVYIPFSTLQFHPGETHGWGINFERNIRHKNEQVRWQGWSRNFSLSNVSQAGTLIGLNHIKAALRGELKPYVLAGASHKNADGTTELLHKLGGDFNKNLLSTLKLNLTVNTDFAQVEADRVPVNLSRFDVYFPEKREFFLEGAQNYSFSLGNANDLFYSRRIGVSGANELLPIIAGARVFGKAGGTNIGFLSIQTAQKGETPSTNYSMIRLRQDVGRQSNIGMVVTSTQSDSVHNLVFGGDIRYETSKFLKNRSIVIYGSLFGSRTSGLNGHETIGYRLYVDYPNDLIDNYIGVSQVPRDFIPGIGFLNRSDYRNYVWYFRFTPRWLTSWGIRKWAFRPWGFNIYQTASTGNIESWDNTTRPIGFATKSGEYFEFNLKQSFDHPRSAFSLSDSIVIPVGKYQMSGYEIQMETFTGRRVFGKVIFYNGRYYGGHIKTLETDLGLNISKHLNLTAQWIFNDVTLPEGKLHTHEFTGRLLYAFTTKLNVALFAQWNSVEEFIGFNFRVHWIPKIGSDCYFVINQAYNKQLRFNRLGETSGVAKMVWRFAF